MELDKVYEGDCLDVMKTFPDKSIDCVITSPPYWQLRDYAWDGQWGMEKTFQEYLEHLWQLMDETRRVLKNEGTVWVNLGDTYFGGSGGPSGIERKQLNTEWNDKSERNLHTTHSKENNVPNKCLLLIPHRFAIGCIDRGWIMRNDIIWAKRNGMPESVTDRFTKKHEYFFFMTKKEKYYFDLNRIRLTPKQETLERMKRGISENNKWINGADGQTPHNLSKPRKNTRIESKYTDEFGRLNWTGEKTTEGHPYGANPGTVSDFWDIPTKPNKENHYASYNTKLISKPILAGCPKGGIILDPFCGTGTTGCLAIELGRKFIGIEGKKEYVEMANRNIGLVKAQSFIDLDELIIKQ